MKRNRYCLFIIKVIGLGLSIFLILCFTLLFRYKLPQYSYELKLFWSYKEAAVIPSLRSEILLNYILFMPLGFMLKIVWPKLSWRGILAICFLSSLTIELIQLVSRLGFFDVDDILGNTAGGMIGYLGGRFIVNFLKEPLT